MQQFSIGTCLTSYPLSAGIQNPCMSLDVSYNNWQTMRTEIKIDAVYIQMGYKDAAPGSYVLISPFLNCSVSHGIKRERYLSCISWLI